MHLEGEVPEGVTVRLPGQFGRQAANEGWDQSDWLNAGRWMTRLRDEFGVYELEPVVDASKGEVVALQAWSRTFELESVRFRAGPRWPMLQALADLWFLFGEKKVRRAATLASG